MNRTLFDLATCDRHHALAYDRGVEYRLTCVKPYGHAGRCVTHWTETGQRG